MFSCDQRSRSEQVAVRSVLPERFSNPELKNLFLDALKDIYFAEKKILSALPKMAKAAQSPKLKQLLKSTLPNRCSSRSS
jgi:hypothetical protein